jgi:hypothetical protein
MSAADRRHVRVRPLTETEHAILLSWLKGNDGAATARERRRARVILLSSYGISAYVISILIPMGRNNVVYWIRRFNREGLQGLSDRPRPGRPPIRDRRPPDEG